MKFLSIVLPEELLDTFTRASALHVVPTTENGCNGFTDAANRVCHGLVAAKETAAEMRAKGGATGQLAEALNVLELLLPCLAEAMAEMVIFFEPGRGFAMAGHKGRVQ